MCKDGIGLGREGWDLKDGYGIGKQVEIPV